MKAFNTKKMGYFCERCECTFPADTYRAVRVICIPTDVRIYDHAEHGECDGEDCDQVYAEASDVRKESAWYCGNGCFYHDAGLSPENLSEMWQCGECGDSYLDSDAAVACCQ